jgi:hypothetical protein
MAQLAAAPVEGEAIPRHSSRANMIRSTLKVDAATSPSIAMEYATTLVNFSI